MEQEQRIQQIIACLEYLKKTAVKENLSDIEELIDATFKICLNTYMILKRSEMSEALEKIEENIKAA